MIYGKDLGIGFMVMGRLGLVGSVGFIIKVSVGQLVL